MGHSPIESLRSVRSPRAALVLAALFVAPACELEESPEEIRERWESEREIQGEMGRPANADVVPGHVFVSGVSNAGEMSAPFALTPLAAQGVVPFTFLLDATIDGSGSGTLTIEGASIEVTAGRAQAEWIGAETSVWSEDFVDGRYRVRPASTGVVEVAAPPSWPEAVTASLSVESSEMLLEGLRVTAAVRAVLVTDDGEVEVALPFTVSAQALAWTAGSAMHVSTLSLDYERVALGGEVASAVLTFDDGETIDDAQAIVGHEAHVEITGVEGALTATLRATQVLTADGVAIPAEIEIDRVVHEIELRPGESQAVGMQFREKTYVGDAVVKEILPSGEHADLVSFAVDPPERYIARLFELIENAGIFWPIAVVVVIILAPVVVLVEVVDALLCPFGCSSPPTPVPLPAWIDAGAIGSFSFVVTGADTVGSYETTVSVVGHNFDTVEIALSVTVAED
jgi:hypothetical protein